MFEFSIKSSKDIKELSIVFDDGEAKVISKVGTTKKENPPKKLKNKKDDRGDFLDFGGIEDKVTSNLIVEKPDVPEVHEINVADELHNLDF